MEELLAKRALAEENKRKEEEEKKLRELEEFERIKKLQ
jgi:hypothetical protein